jgi:prolyl-tRNA editing enzyme YbaK/EbsC (Cys-tRNA(Pro) deacylase)
MGSDDIRRRLSVLPDAEGKEHLPPFVRKDLPAGEVEVFLVDDDASDTEQFSARYGIGMEDCANTLVVKYRKGGVDRHAAIVSLGSRRLDVNGAVKAALGAQRLTFAKREAAVELTGMESGGITCFGLPADWPVLVDAAVMTRPFVVMGAGMRCAKLLLAPTLLVDPPRWTVAALTFDP